MDSKQKDVVDYYNQTQVHYERWWKLKTSKSLHYGIWCEETKTFEQALENTNKHLLDLAAIQANHVVLDAGCGVGGAAIYIHQQTGARVHGITLPERQYAQCVQNATEAKLTDVLSFKHGDYCHTGFEPNTFDVVWACESISSTENKSGFLKEAYRVLKPGGRLVLAEYFVTSRDQKDPNNWIRDWEKSWALAPLPTEREFVELINKAGFKNTLSNNKTAQIQPSAKWMYRAYQMGKWPSRIYNATLGASRYAKEHYKSGLFQYKALEANLWQYVLLCATKPIDKM